LPPGNTPGTEGSRKLRFSNFMTTAQDGGKVVRLTYWPPLPPGNTPSQFDCNRAKATRRLIVKDYRIPAKCARKIVTFMVQD
jgi:hypothetical protein